MSEPSCVIVLTTLPGGHDAAPVARTLVEERLAACVSVLGTIRSFYQWEGAVQDEAEQQLVIKTTAERVPMLRHRLTSLHPYDVPEFLVLTVSGGSKDYLRWVHEATDTTI